MHVERSGMKQVLARYFSLIGILAAILPSFAHARGSEVRSLVAAIGGVVSTRFLSLGTPVSCSNTPSTTDEYSAEERLARQLRGNAFVVHRGLNRYSNLLKELFTRRLGQLGPSDHWIDAGCGRCVAIGQFLSEGVLDQKPSVTGVTFVHKGSPIPSHGDKLRVLEGRLFEDIPAKELGEASLITDIYGPFSYSSRLDDVVRKYFEVLKPEGAVLIYFRGHPRTAYMGPVESFGPDFLQKHSDHTVIVTRGGTEKIPVLEWLKRNPTFNTQNPEDDYGTVQLTRKPGVEPVIPSLKLIRTHGTHVPLAREFEETENL